MNNVSCILRDLRLYFYIIMYFIWVVCNYRLTSSSAGYQIACSYCPAYFVSHRSATYRLGLNCREFRIILCPKIVYFDFRFPKPQSKWGLPQTHNCVSPSKDSMMKLTAVLIGPTQGESSSKTQPKNILKVLEFMFNGPKFHLKVQLVIHDN